MPNVSFSGLLIVTVVAFLAPLLLGLSPVRRLPAVVLEIVAGIVIGPAVLGWVKVDLPISILSVFGLAFLYRPLVGNRRSVVAGLLQATSLSFIVAASQIGLELGLITKATGAALIAAVLLSVLIFPIMALTILRRSEPSLATVDEQI
jgi:Kef-type K+ transport system membrane component KefB